VSGEQLPSDAGGEPELGDEPRFGDKPDTDDEPDTGDDELVARLRQIAGHLDPVPDLLSQAARSAFGMRELDARLAELVHDSAVDVPATAVRGPGPRLLSFEADDVVVECEVTVRESRRDIIGQLMGGHASEVEARMPAAAVTVPVDDRGFFSIRGLPAGLVQLRCRLAVGATVVTSWATL